MAKGLGAAGEAIARRYLEQHGMQFVEANWRCESGEIDLVMLDGAEVVMVEVKTRRSQTAGDAEESVTWSKGRKALTTGDWYIASHPRFHESIWRIDLVAVTISPNGAVERITHRENAIVVG